ncbi:MAG TPA: hypothetical protein VMU80_16200 [Bryobacteraceae bacterium]|nr:hypothetical protein [Bryobacteraceae bacterium]HUO30769.1 hypothetical protein [Bryobacteraceae bacterium]
MPKLELIPFQVESSPGEFTHYVVVERRAPVTDELPWKGEECDAFVIVLDGNLLSNELAAEIAEGLVQLPVDWIETMGDRCEYLHDLIDEVSVSIGRQGKVGEGDPMTAWHEEFSDEEEMVSYIRMGGHGAAEKKIVVVVGPEHRAAAIAHEIAQS